jgi:hypothetical protein
MLSAILGSAEAAQPSHVECLLIFDPRLGGEADSERKVLFCHPPDMPVDAQLNAIGLAEGLNAFASRFAELPIEAVHTERRRYTLLEAEPSIWLCLVTANPTRAGFGADELPDSLLRRRLAWVHAVLVLFLGPLARIEPADALRSALGAAAGPLLALLDAHGLLSLDAPARSATQHGAAGGALAAALGGGAWPSAGVPLSALRLGSTGCTSSSGAAPACSPLAHGLSAVWIGDGDGGGGGGGAHGGSLSEADRAAAGAAACAPSRVACAHAAVQVLTDALRASSGPLARWCDSLEPCLIQDGRATLWTALDQSEGAALAALVATLLAQEPLAARAVVPPAGASVSSSLFQFGQQLLAPRPAASAAAAARAARAAAAAREPPPPPAGRKAPRRADGTDAHGATLGALCGAPLRAALARASASAGGCLLIGGGCGLIGGGCGLIGGGCGLRAEGDGGAALPPARVHLRRLPGEPRRADAAPRPARLFLFVLRELAIGLVRPEGGGAESEPSGWLAWDDAAADGLARLLAPAAATLEAELREAAAHARAAEPAEPAGATLRVSVDGPSRALRVSPSRPGLGGAATGGAHALVYRTADLLERAQAGARSDTARARPATAAAAAAPPGRFPVEVCMRGRSTDGWVVGRRAADRSHILVLADARLASLDEVQRAEQQLDALALRAGAPGPGAGRLLS